MSEIVFVPGVCLYQKYAQNVNLLTGISQR